MERIEYVSRMEDLAEYLALERLYIQPILKSKNKWRNLRNWILFDTVLLWILLMTGMEWSHVACWGLILLGAQAIGFVQWEESVRRVSRRSARKSYKEENLTDGPRVLSFD